MTKNKATNPQGQITRGKTARNRLRRVDNFLALYDRALLTREDGEFAQSWFVDLGYGAEAFTTLESAKRLRRINPDLRMLGVEIDPERVTAAAPYADAQTAFRLGGFNLPLKKGETVRAIRAFNVLRQYEEREVLDAHATMGDALLIGGLLIEGTSDPFGRIWTANLLRKSEDGALLNEGLLFSTNFRWGFEPGMFQPVLPKNTIHRMVEGEWIHSLMESWKEVALENIALKKFGLRQWFVASAEGLAERGFSIDLRKKLLGKGYLLVRQARIFTE